MVPTNGCIDVCTGYEFTIFARTRHTEVLLYLFEFRMSSLESLIMLAQLINLTRGEPIIETLLIEGVCFGKLESWEMQKIRKQI